MNPTNSIGEPFKPNTRLTLINSLSIMSSFAQMQEEEEIWMKFQLICKPEQSGKTFIMIQEIIAGLYEPSASCETINFIFCDNSLLLTKQTSDRVRTSLQPHLFEKNTCIEISSKTKINSAEVFHSIACNGVRNVFCCTNQTRMDDVRKIINDIKAVFPTKYNFHIWLDEADKWISYIETTLMAIASEHENVLIHLITATPDDLFTRFKEINVFPIENTTSAQYHGWEDNERRLLHIKCGLIDFVEHVLSHYTEDCIRPGTKWFIPAKHTKASHEQVKELAISHGMACIVINGDGLKLTVPDTKEVFKYKKDDTVQNLIEKVYKKHNLVRFALVITGNLCVGRGITIMSETFMIDYGIVSFVANKSDASQIAGRFKGNIKGFANYVPPVIFTTEHFDENAIEFENRSRALAKLAYEKEQNGEEPVVSRLEYKTCAEDYDYACESTQFENCFDSFARAKAFLATKEDEMQCKVRVSETSAIHKIDGYSITSKLLKVGQTVADLTAEHRLTIQKANAISWSANISSTKKGSRYLILPVYAREDSPANEVKFQVRYISFK